MKANPFFRMRAKAMAFKGSRINPVAGLKRIFGMQGVIELFKATAKVVALGYAGYWVMASDIASMPGLAATLIALNWSVGLVSARSPKVERWIEGVPVLLARDGQVYREVLRRELISREDFEKAMREAGCLDMADIRLAVLENNGHITVVGRQP